MYLVLHVGFIRVVHFLNRQSNSLITEVIDSLIVDFGQRTLPHEGLMLSCASMNRLNYARWGWLPLCDLCELLVLALKYVVSLRIAD